MMVWKKLLPGFARLNLTNTLSADTFRVVVTLSLAKGFSTHHTL